jgi:hypothetical protein
MRLGEYYSFDFDGQEGQKMGVLRNFVKQQMILRRDD